MTNYNDNATMVAETQDNVSVENFGAKLKKRFHNFFFEETLEDSAAENSTVDASDGNPAKAKPEISEEKPIRQTYNKSREQSAYTTPNLQQVKMKYYTPQDIKSAKKEVAECIKGNVILQLNCANLDDAFFMRLFDFIDGALNMKNYQKVRTNDLQAIYVLAPPSIDISEIKNQIMHETTSAAQESFSIR